MPRFDEHLRSVDETYLEHMGHALSFAGNLAVGAVVCLVHAVFPFLFEKRGSDIVNRLYDRMVINRHTLKERNRKGTDTAAISNP